MPVTLTKRPLTVEQFNRMIDARIFREDDRLELIEGDLVEMAPIGSRHAAYVDRVNDLFRLLPAEVITRVQSPIELNPTTRVEPDVVVLRRRADYYADRLPGPADILLVVEVAETSLEYDRAVKIPAYAKAGIPEAWLVNADADQIEVYRLATAAGYRDERLVSPGGELTLSALPDLRFPASRVIGPP